MPAEQVSAPSKKILILTPQFPYPPHQGTTMRNYNLIAGLAQRHEVHLLAFGDPDESAGTPLDGLCESIQVVPPPERSMAGRLKGLLFSRLPDMALRLPSEEFAERLARDHHNIDDGFFDRLREQFSEPEILELGMMAGQYIGFGRLLMVLDLTPKYCPTDGDGDLV